MASRTDVAMSGKLMRLLRRIRGPMLPLAGAGGHRALDRLICCAICGSSVVNPVDCHESDETRWWVRLRCGECAWAREALITNAEAKQLERDLEPGLREIAKAAAKLDRERMLWETEVFVAALRRDLIGPADFTRDCPR
jgi:hypothetical protein